MIGETTGVGIEFLSNTRTRGSIESATSLLAVVSSLLVRAEAKYWHLSGVGCEDLTHGAVASPSGCAVPRRSDLA